MRELENSAIQVDIYVGTHHASLPSIIIIVDQDWHRWIGPVIGCLLCVLKAVTELSEHKFSSF